MTELCSATVHVSVESWPSFQPGKPLRVQAELLLTAALEGAGCDPATVRFEGPRYQGARPATDDQPAIEEHWQFTAT